MRAKGLLFSMLVLSLLVHPSIAQGPRRGDMSSGEMPRPLLLRGNVVFSDGGPFPSAVKVAFSCQGVVRRETWVDSNGQFSLTLRGPAESEVMSAEVSTIGPSTIIQAPGVQNPTGRGSRAVAIGPDVRSRIDLSGCTLRAVASGYLSSRIDLAVRRVLDDPNVGTLTLTPTTQIKATSISLNSLEAPRKARQVFDKAVKELSKEKPNFTRAKQELDKATQLHPAFAEAWTLLGRIRVRSRDVDGGREAFQKAMAADPAYLVPYLFLAELEVQLERWQQAAEASRGVLDLNPETIQAQYIYALAQFNLEDLEAAEPSAQKVATSAEVDKYPGVYYLLGAIKANRGEISQAADNFQLFLQHRPDVPDDHPLRQQLRQWEGEGLIP